MSVCLVLELHHTPDRDPEKTTATIACQVGRVPHQVSRHTLLTKLTTCTDCQVVAAAYATVATVAHAMYNEENQP